MASLNSTIVFEAGGKRFVTTEAVPFQSHANTPLETLLVTVVANHDGVPLSKAWLKTFLNKLDGCDVFDRNLFLSGVIITTLHRGQVVPHDSWEYLKELGMKWLDVMVEGGKMPPLQALTYTPIISFIPSSLTVFEQLGVASTSNSCLAIAVPSQAPALVADTPPNLRVAVKDCFLVRGMKISLCNRAYYKLSEPVAFTADAIQALIDSGAQILRLTKLSSMIAREEPMDAVEYPTAFNPRGDGYQSPAGSSSGSAAAVAAYDWLDCAIGTDTSGSGRRPALANGVWQFRPSHDSISLKGLVKTYAVFDTPCAFARSLDVIRRVAKTWITAPLTVTKKPYRLIYPFDYLPTENSEKQRAISSFIRDAETHLPAVIVKLSIKSSWQQSHPVGAPDDVEEYLKDVIRGTFYHQFYHSYGSFRQLNADRNDGQLPYVIPFVQRRWAQGASVSDAEHEEATHRLLVYRNWLQDQFFRDESFETLIILPVAEVKPVYRDEKTESPENQSAYDQLFLPPILGSPDVVVPIGETPYHSKITNKIEYLPVVANLIAAPGRDHELLEAKVAPPNPRWESAAKDISVAKLEDLALWMYEPPIGRGSTFAPSAITCVMWEQGLSTCTNIACATGNAIILCNDNGHAISPRCSYLTDYIDHIIRVCSWTVNSPPCTVRPCGPSWSVGMVREQQFDSDNYNVIVAKGIC
ncbi:amidase signature domain protein [Fusarium sp. NRRL 52700]|nr:amidase signature domain protein [Fusarium sp. NRRL 52700]